MEIISRDFFTRVSTTLVASRREVNFSIPELASALNIDENILLQLEIGFFDFTLTAYLPLICKALNLSQRDFYQIYMTGVSLDENYVRERAVRRFGTSENLLSVYGLIDGNRRLIDYTRVDKEIYDEFSEVKINIRSEKYAYYTEGETKRDLHREIYERFHEKPNPEMKIDHDNGIELDNRISNLILRTHGENQRKRKRDQNFKSKYSGISIENGKWLARAYLASFERRTRIGTCTKEIDAAWMRDEFVIRENSNNLSALNRTRFPKDFENYEPIEDFLTAKTRVEKSTKPSRKILSI